MDVTHEVFEVQVGRGVGGARRPRLTSLFPIASPAPPLPTCLTRPSPHFPHPPLLSPLADPAPPLPSYWQEEFAIGLGEIARARAAEKVRMPVGCFLGAFVEGGVAFTRLARSSAGGSSPFYRAVSATCRLDAVPGAT